MVGIEGESDAIQEAPPLAAVFLIKFDLKVGYTIAWRRSLPNVPLDGVVEFKSLPSGLHNVKDDLVYFVHEQYAGHSAFVNGPATEAERNAHLVAVGVLVPLSHGRLGRSWLHAQRLQDLAERMVENTTATEPLEEFWDAYKAGDEGQFDGTDTLILSPTTSRSGNRRKRALSELTRHGDPGHTLAQSHPARSMLRYVNAFGPLVFPLYKAALMRKRMLFITPPPVRLCCEYVYGLSILSSISTPLADSLPSDSEHALRLRPFFTVGVHDIPLLEREAKAMEEAGREQRSQPRGWVACTTDEILAMKTKLYDIVVEMPATHDHAPKERRWPKVKTSQGTMIKATQRDHRRYRTLRRALRRIQAVGGDETDRAAADDDQSPLIDRGTDRGDDDDDSMADEDQLVEPITWSALAYSSFMWWASAGEKDAVFEEEAEQDQELLSDFAKLAGSGGVASRYTDNPEHAPAEATLQDSAATSPMIVVAYFHRLTSLIFRNLADVVRSAVPDESAEQGAVVVHSEDLRRMGLDVWSETDRTFVRELVRLYFGRDADVHGASVECCGVKIC